jgi:hypothetical protein
MFVSYLVVIFEILDRSQSTCTTHRAHACGEYKTRSYRTDGVDYLSIGSDIATLDPIGFP